MSIVEDDCAQDLRDANDVASFSEEYECATGLTYARPSRRCLKHETGINSERLINCRNSPVCVGVSMVYSKSPLNSCGTWQISCGTPMGCLDCDI